MTEPSQDHVKGQGGAVSGLAPDSFGKAVEPALALQQNLRRVGLNPALPRISRRIRP